MLYGETADGAWFFDLLTQGSGCLGTARHADVRPGLSGRRPLDPTAAVAALPDDAEICGCNGVCKGKIVQAITEKGLSSLDDVRAHTKASASCGSCTGLVEQVLAFTLGDDYSRTAEVKPMCNCTDLSHDDVRRLIIARRS